MLNKIIKNIFKASLSENSDLFNNITVMEGFMLETPINKIDQNIKIISYRLRVFFDKKVSEEITVEFYLKNIDFNLYSYIPYVEIQYNGKNGDIINTESFHINSVRSARAMMFKSKDVRINEKIKIFNILKKYKILNYDDIKGMKFI